MTTTVKPNAKLEVKPGAKLEVKPAAKSQPGKRDPECTRLGKHRSNCDCTNELRAPIK